MPSAPTEWEVRIDTLPDGHSNGLLYLLPRYLFLFIKCAVSVMLSASSGSTVWHIRNNFFTLSRLYGEQRLSEAEMFALSK